MTFISREYLVWRDRIDVPSKRTIARAIGKSAYSSRDAQWEE